MKKEKSRMPRLGIVFLVRSRLFVASKLLDACEKSGEFTNYPGDHQPYWTQLQKTGAVPMECEYEEFPRGRAVLNQLSGKYSLYLDRCILRNRKLVTRILS